jgi:hypothetical protein
MKKLVCLVTVLAMIGVASADIDVIVNGAMQGPWTAGDFSQATVGGRTAMQVVKSSWMSLGFNGTEPALNGLRYLEFDIYLGSGEAGRRVEAMHIDADGDESNPGWYWKWQNPTDTWIDGSGPVNFDEWTATADTWTHVKIDLTTNCGPSGPGGVEPFDVDTQHVGLIRFHPHWPNTTDVAISDMAFTPEPATIALLGLGGLALIRRKR